jgi:Flp pilus assembly protein CpaB
MNAITLFAIVILVVAAGGIGALGVLGLDWLLEPPKSNAQRDYERNQR